MLTRALAPWLLLAAFVLFPLLTAAGVARAQDLEAIFQGDGIPTPDSENRRRAA